MWRSKFQAFLSSIGCLYVLKATDNPNMVGDMNVSQEELEQGHSQKEIMDARLVYGFLMDLSLIHISEPTRLGMISYAVFCLKKKN